MAQSPVQRRLVLSILDRLTDREPKSPRDPPANTWDQVQELKRGLARDLTNLLNTRRSDADIPEEFELTNQSIAAYGLNDLAASPVDREQIRRSVERCIRSFEPRLSHVTVLVEQTADFRLDFRIVAMLRMDVRTEPVVFDAILPRHSRRFDVQEGR